MGADVSWEYRPETGAEVFTALRGWNLRLIGAALPDAGIGRSTHPERGTMTFLTVVETMAGHDLNHLGQLRKMRMELIGRDIPP